MDFNFLVAEISSNYGAFEYKQKMGIIQWEKVLEEYRVKIIQSQNNDTFYYVLKEFLAKFKDSHNDLSFPR